MNVREFWDEQAKKHGNSKEATAPDIHYRELEIRAIKSVMSNPVNVLDVGCGNGYTTSYLAAEYPLAMFTGVDYSEEMIRATTPSKNCLFDIADVTGIRWWAGDRKWDHIISCRCLINLENWDQQKRAIDDLCMLLSKNGRLILVENVDGGLDRLNSVRESFGLGRIEQRWHNHYLPETFLLNHINSNYDVIDNCNIGSPYYIISRVVHAEMARRNGNEPSYDHPLNEIASRLPVFGNYSPNYVFVLKNREAA